MFQTHLVLFENIENIVLIIFFFVFTSFRWDSIIFVAFSIDWSLTFSLSCKSLHFFSWKINLQKTPLKAFVLKHGTLLMSVRSHI